MSKSDKDFGKTASGTAAAAAQLQCEQQRLLAPASAPGFSQLDLIKAFVAATTASKAIEYKIPPTVNPQTFSDKPHQDVGLFLTEFETICQAQG